MYQLQKDENKSNVNGNGNEAMKTTELDIPTPSVAVTVIAIEHTDQILAVLNPRWGSFTLPMTKQKRWIDPEVPAGKRWEKLELAATRAATEALGRTFNAAALPVPVLKELDCRQSDAEGIWKLYALHIFGLKVPAGTGVAPCTIAEWLTPADFGTREPISPTSRYVIACLQREGKLPPWP